MEVDALSKGEGELEMEVGFMELIIVKDGISQPSIVRDQHDGLLLIYFHLVIK